MSLPVRLDIVEPGDRAALVCIDQEELLDQVLRQIDTMGFRVHTATPGEDLLVKLHGHPYDLAVTWQFFGGRSVEENSLILESAELPMQVRRRQFFVLIGPDMDTGNELLAFRHSVNLVVHPNDIRNLPLLVKNGVARLGQRYSRFEDVAASANLG
jgi:hypothetical protein